jgi:putative DNA primase/helicase
MTPGREPSAQELAARLGGKRSGSTWMCECPAHIDKKASLAITEAGGRTVFKCHAGCEQKAVLAALQSAGHWPKPNGVADKPVIVATYDYRDELGDLVFQSVRYAPKAFRQRRPNGTGWAWNVTDTRIVPYRLPELLEAVAADRPVVVVEGEKDADNLARFGIVATCNAGGAKKWRMQHSAFLKGGDVIVVPDNDGPGREHAAVVARSLDGIAARVRMLELPGLPEKGDVSDWIEAGGTADAFWGLADGVPEWSKATAEPDGLPKAVALPEFMRMQFPPLEMIVAPIIPTKGLTLLYAKRGVGKTHSALGISYAAASGGVFLRWKAPKAHNVLHIDGEMQAAALQERWLWTMNGGVCPGTLRIMSSDAAGMAINLQLPETQAYIDTLLDGVDLVTLDNLSSLTNASENDPDAWMLIQGWLLRLRFGGISVLMAHHAGKGGGQRGTSRREDLLDASIELMHPADYRPEQGARFEVHYRKARRILGEDVKPFEARLQTNGTEAAWTMIDLDNAEEERVAKLLADGLSVRDAAQELGMSKSAVHRAKKRIEERED